MDIDSADTAKRIEAHVEDALATHSPSKVWVAYSGGIDSTALLLACQKVVTGLDAPVKLMAIHVNHGLHENAATWAQHCKTVCNKLDVELIVANIDVARAGNVEANARAARYEAFAAHIAHAELLLLGHHQQDQTETVLYRLFQGRGLLPMRGVGTLGEGGFARPLLAESRDVLVAYVSDNKLSWVEDDSNADVSLTRNFLRHKVIPELSARWQGLHHSVQRVAAKQGHTEAALEDVLTGLPDTVALADLPVEPMVRQAWLRAYLATRGVYTVSDKALAEFDAQSAQSGHAHLSLGSASLRGYAGHLYFEAEQVVEARPQSLVLGQAVTLAYGTLSLEPAEAGSKLAFVYLGPLQVRYRRGGERLRVIAGGQTKTLKQLFAEERVPPWQRGHHPLLYEGEELRCVPGLAVAATMDQSNQGLSKQNGLCEAFWRVE